MNPLMKRNIRLEKAKRWDTRKLVACPVCSVMVFDYDQERHAAKHAKEARDQKLTARKARKNEP